MATHRALVGIDYPPNKRVEAGETVTDLPGDAVKWLIADGCIEVAKAGAPASEPIEPAFKVTAVVISGAGVTPEPEPTPEPTPEPAPVVEEETP